MNNFRVKTQILLLALLSTLALTEQAVHNHNRKEKVQGGEREADGAFSPRDHHHATGKDHDNAFDHEAILGSKKEAEEYDELDPEEAKRRLEVLLTKMDRDNDRAIDRKELYAWILRSFKALSKEDSDERFEDTDEDDNGFISWNEYKDDEFDFGDGEIDETDDVVKEELQLMEEDKMLFDAADANKDQKLDKDEFLAFTHPEEDPNMKPHVINQVLKEKDADNDGEISFQEYIGARGKDKDKEWLIEEKERFDTELDKNGDNSLNKEEIVAWIIPSNEDVANEEVDHLFTGADADMDDILKFEEILKNHELFVGSEATDYGDHLKNLHRFGDEL